MKKNIAGLLISASILVAGCETKNTDKVKSEMSTRINDNFEQNFGQNQIEEPDEEKSDKKTKKNEDTINSKNFENDLGIEIKSKIDDLYNSCQLQFSFMYKREIKENEVAKIIDITNIFMKNLSEIAQNDPQKRQAIQLYLLWLDYKTGQKMSEEEKKIFNINKEKVKNYILNENESINHDNEIFNNEI